MSKPRSRRVASDDACFGWHTLAIPKPPSVNAMFANRRPGGGGKGRYPTKRYASWKVEAGLLLMASRPPRISGTYELRIQFGRRKGADLGNFEKAISDLLVAHAIVQDDSLCERLTLEWADDLSAKQCRVSYAAAVRAGPHVDRSEAGSQISLVPPIERAPKRRPRVSARIVAERKAGVQAMSKLRDFARGMAVQFTDSELQSLIDAGLVWIHDYPVPRPLLTEAGWAVIEGPSEEESRGPGV